MHHYRRQRGANLIDNNDIERLKEIFVTRRECESNTDGIAKKLSNDDKRLAVIETYQKIQLWILTAIGGGIITVLVKMFFGEA